MKKVYFVFAVSFLSQIVFAQDVIVKRDGSSIISKVLEVNTDDVKYKKFSNLNGPTYTIKKSDLLSINYENGEKEDYSDYKEEKKQNDTPSGFVKPVPSPDNSDIINSYNISHPSLSPNNGKKSSGLFTILGVDTSSILADNNIEIIFRHYNYDELDWENIFLARNCQECDYEIIIANKSNYTVYIDLGNTFRVFNDLSYAPFFNGEQTTISSGGSSGIGLSLGSVANVAGVGGVAGTLAGGITVGGSSTRSHSTTYTKQRIISIPPQSSQSLGKCQWEHPNGRGNIRISSAESIPESNLGINKGFVKAGETYTYNYENSPYKRSFLVTYSVNMNFSTYTTLKANLYLRTIIGTPKSYSHRTKKLEKDFEETIGNFNSKTLCAYYEY